MNYQRIHDLIIAQARIDSPVGFARRRSIKYSEYKERHHIKPRCLFANKKDPLMNVAENLIYLSAKQHFVIHHLLTKIHPDNWKIRYAFSQMFNSPKKSDRANDVEWKKLSAKKFEFHKKKMAEYSSLLNTGKKASPETKAKLSKIVRARYAANPDSWKGSKRTEATKKLQAEVRRNYLATRPDYSYAAHWQITLPDGSIIKVKNLKRYCKDNGIPAFNMYAVNSGLLSSYNGYLVKKIGASEAPITSKELD